jgi:hypothetical protein
MSADQGPQDKTMNGVLSANELERLRQGLDDLPETMPPRAVWHRIREQARAEGLLAKPASHHPVKWLVGAGIAAAVVLAVLRIPGALNPDSGAQIAGDQDLRATPQSMPTNGQELNALMVQSQQLEQNLRAIPYQPRMMRASTAATISNLEDRIAAIDYRLNHPAIRMSTAERQLYWRERVRLMDSLVMLRYAQAQRASF